METKLIDSANELQAFLNDLPPLHRSSPDLYIDLEGNNLSRHGSIAIVTILIRSRKRVYLVDVTSLGRMAFSTQSTGQNGASLKSILESPSIPKVFFDIRNDSDALFSLFGISVAGIHDLQLMELASRSFSKRTVNGLAKCIEQDAGLTYTECALWTQNKTRGRRLFAPELGGSYAVFDQRPLSEHIKLYCTQDVVHMPRLYDRYVAKLCDAWWNKIQDETRMRMSLSQSASYNGQGRHMAMAPAAWRDWRPSSGERRVRTIVGSLEQGIEENEGATVTTESGTSSTCSPRTISTGLASMNLEDTESDDVAGSHADFQFSGHFHCGYSSPRGYSSDSVRDLTACDKECGYCGTCPY